VKLDGILLAAQAGIDGMRASAMRTMLSTVGVVIGVASLVGVLSLGDGMESYVRESIGKEAMQVVRVRPRTTHKVNGRTRPVASVVMLTPRDLAQVRALPDVADASLWIGGTATFRAEGREAEEVSTVATLENGIDFDYLDLVEGRFFVRGEAASNAPVLVVSRGLAEKLSGSRPYASLLGGRVWTGGAPRRVIGIFEMKDELAYVPLRAAAQVMGRGLRQLPAHLLVRARSLETVEPVKSSLEDWAAVRFGPPEERLELTTYAARIEQAAQAIAVFKAVMGAIIGISLVVGGIGVMNVLLASVAERTREIGVRRALGARRRAILAQFLFESLAITGLGSVAGIVLGSVGALGMSPLIRSLTGQAITVAPTAQTLLTAVLCPALVGVVFGIYPAHRASRLSPIDALRHE
jgi:putative ABC transport system permease protein